LANNSRSGDNIYIGIPGIVVITAPEEAPGKGNGNWMLVEYGYMFEGNFIGSGIFGEYMHMEHQPDFTVNSFLNSNQFIGTVGNTGKSFGAHLHYSIYTLQGDGYSFSDSILRLILNNSIANTVVSKDALYYRGTNKNIAKKVTYDIENFLKGL
jgi:murein DD-endopeptidase MepM/ murein hydrolase activator NlpD